MNSDPISASSAPVERAPQAPSVAHGDAVRGAERAAGRGSWLLASAGQRMAAAALVSAALWGMTGWAMGWW
uniref:hypothetical protein n=1 Tax=Bordetella sputigena TaxID=1416810 RepID=UPI0039EF2B43